MWTGVVLMVEYAGGKGEEDQKDTNYGCIVSGNNPI
jgi:hypothetical protein